MAEYNWELYNFDKYGRDENILPPGNLLPYPVQVRVWNGPGSNPKNV